MTPDTTIDPRLLDDYPTETQPRAVALPSRTTLDDASGEEGREKRRKLNLYKCRQCRDARKKVGISPGALLIGIQDHQIARRI